MFQLDPALEEGREPGGPTPPPRYNNRWVQMRLLVLVGGLVLVVWAMVEAAKPANWEWMYRGEARAAVEDQEVAGREIDTRFEPRPRPPLPPDGFVSIPDEPPNPGPPPGDPYFPGVDYQLLPLVEDNAFGENSKRWRVRAHLWEVLRDASADALTQGEPQRVGFIQLKEQSDYYRGRLIEMRGTLWRVQEKQFPAIVEDPPAASYFECVLRPAGDQNHPVFVDLLKLPADLPPRDQFGEFAKNERPDVRLVGFFFRMEPYQDGAGETRVAPRVLARSAGWRPQVAPREVPLPSWQVAVAALAACTVVAVGIAYVAWSFSNARGEASSTYSVAGQTRGEQLKELEALPTYDPGAALRELAENERSSPR